MEEIYKAFKNDAYHNRKSRASASAKPRIADLAKLELKRLARAHMYGDEKAEWEITGNLILCATAYQRILKEPEGRTWSDDYYASLKEKGGGGNSQGG